MLLLAAGTQGGSGARSSHIHYNLYNMTSNEWLGQRRIHEDFLPDAQSSTGKYTMCVQDAMGRVRFHSKCTVPNRPSKLALPHLKYCMHIGNTSPIPFRAGHLDVRPARGSEDTHRRDRQSGFDLQAILPYSSQGKGHCIGYEEAEGFFDIYIFFK